MLDADASAMVADMLRECLGASCRLGIRTDGFRLRPTKAAAACCLGEGGRVVQVEMSGFGFAFEERRLSAQLVLDLRANRDDLATSVLKQASPLVSHQLQLRTRASALGIRKPLDPLAFMDLSRLRIDVEAARALLIRFRSDAEVRRWLRAQLGRIAAPSANRDLAPTLRVHGLVAAVPFHLATMTLIEHDGSTLNQVQWADGQIRVPLQQAEPTTQLWPLADDAVRGTVLEDRAIVETALWPSQMTLDAFQKHWRQRQVPERDVASRRDRARRELRVDVEQRLIPVAEAFG